MRKLDFKLCTFILCALVFIVQSCSEDEELPVIEELADAQSGEESVKKRSTHKSARETCFGIGWCLFDGAANDVGSNGNGALWIIGTTRRGGGYNIYARNFNNDSWVSVYGGAIAIDVDPDGVPWIVNNAGNIYRLNASNIWERMPGAAKDIGIGGNGDVWIIGTTKRGGGYNIYKWNPTRRNWDSSDGSGVRISVDVRGIPWIVNDGQQIYRRSSANASVRNAWVRVPGEAVDVGCGAGRVAVIGTNAGSATAGTPNGFRVYYFNGTGWQSAANNAGGTAVDVFSPNEVATRDINRQIWVGR